MIHQGLELSKMSAAQIRDLPQWKKIDSRLNDDLLGRLKESSSDVNWKKLDEEVRETEWMIENARYRLNPASQGPERVTPLLSKGTPARAAYEAELALRERRLATVIARLATMGQTVKYAADPNATAEAAATASTPGGVLLLLLRVGDQERGLIAEGRRAHPELAAVKGWANPPQIAAAVRSAHLLDAGLFLRLRATERALILATDQARSARGLLTDFEGRYRGPLDEAIREAGELPDERRLAAGLILPDELDATMREQTRLSHRELATRYFGAPAKVPALAPEERAALGSDLLAESGRTVSSPERQLDVVLDDPRRKMGGEVLAVFRLPPTIRVFDPHSRSQGLRTITETNALVAANRLPEVASGERSTIEPGPNLQLLTVFPINAEAVRALGGRGEVMIVVDRTPLIPVRRTDVPRTAP